MTRIRWLSAMLLAASVLTLPACSGGPRLKAQPSEPVDLSGSWRAVPAASDDWSRMLKGARHGHRPEDRRRQVNGAAGEEPPGEAPLQPLPDTSPQQLLSRSAQGAEWLDIRQETAQVTIDYGSHSEAYPTDETDPTLVSVPDGIAERYTGWKGREFVIEIHAKNGPQLSERYAIDAASGRLLVETALREGELSIKVRRVFERAPADSKRDAF